MQRKSALSWMNLGFCLLVVFIHIASWSLPYMDRHTAAYVGLLIPWRLSAFVVQGFLFLSGVKLFLSDKPFSYGKFLCRRLTKILIPYVLWVIGYYLFFHFHPTYRYALSFGKLGEYLLLGTVSSHFYFVVALLQFYLLMPLWQWLLRKLPPLPLAVGAVILTALFKQFAHFPYDDRVFPAYLCYFLLGAIVGRKYDTIASALRRRILPLGGVFLLFAALDAALTVRSQVYGVGVMYFEVLHLGYCLAAIAFCMAVALRLPELPAPIALADRASYYVYLAHVLVIYLANGAIARLGVTDLGTAFVLRGAATYLVTFALCMGYVALKERLYEHRNTEKRA